MYIVPKSVINSIAYEFTHQLDIRDYTYDSDVVKSIVAESIENKADLIEMFCKHPNWDEEKLMIKFDVDYERKPDIKAINNFLNWLYDKTPMNDIIIERNAWYAITLFDMVREIARSKNLPDGENGQITINKINETKEKFRFRPGMKTSRVINNICTSYGWDKMPENEYIDKYGKRRNEYDAEFAKYADALNPVKVTRHTCISVNPIDFLLMSNGNSWKSCHYIGDCEDEAGCYSSGTISYALDNNSFIFYTVSADYNGDEIETEPKILRQVFGYNDNQLLQSRLYPQENDTGADQTYENIRNIIQAVITKCKDVPNRWVKKAVRNVYHGDSATCYPDWSYNNKCNISVLKDYKGSENSLREIVMGAMPRCVKCGKLHDISENINHCGKVYTCTTCGREIDKDEIRWINGEPYCDECTVYCEACGENYLPDDCTWVEDEGRYVCNNCRDEYYSCCEICGRWTQYENASTVEGVNICDDCIEDECSYCDECEELFFTDNMEEIEGKLYCKDCAEEIRANKEEEETT